MVDVGEAVLVQAQPRAGAFEQLGGERAVQRVGITATSSGSAAAAKRSSSANSRASLQPASSSRKQSIAGRRRGVQRVLRRDRSQCVMIRDDPGERSRR